ncbi:MAG: hypothetical protein M1828_003175 [Chrysothrix sp. TS-e1954]|nr:MAG: hypothetical protein M1828_003175 [Chrysothrix sp. TS-e1954]
MALDGAQRLRMRPAHAPGPTFLSYTSDGQKLVTVGANESIRIFHTGSDGEPTNIDDCRDSNLAVVANNDFFIAGSEDGSVCKFSLETNSLDQVLVRCTLPIRDLSLSPDGQWVAVASDELVVKVVNTQDMDRVIYLREQHKPVKHVSFDFSGSRSEEPRLVKKIEGLIRSLESEVEASSKLVWHPDGRAFAAPTVAQEIQVMSTADWAHQRAFKAGHNAHITALAWSPNGALLATASADGKMLLWATNTQKVLQRLEDVRGTVQAFSWHPTQNILSYTNTDGELYIHTGFVAPENTEYLGANLEPAPFIHDPLQEISGNAQKRDIHYGKADPSRRRAREGTPDSIDSILASDNDSLKEFVEDDDGAGYVPQVNGFGKRPIGDAGAYGPAAKRRAQQWEPQVHDSFQPGSAPWRGDRRYLCLNLLGVVWTVDQGNHHTVSIEFYDRDYHRDFHFPEHFKYDKACLTEKGTLFASSQSDSQPAQIYFRPHEYWTPERADWRKSLPQGESVTAMALGESFIVVTTSADYVRVYTLFGTPFKIYRQKSTPAVSCASWRDYVLTIGNGAVGGDGRTKLLYTIENVKRDDVCQSEDVVGLGHGTQIRNVFFSDTGDPCIYDTSGVLLVLLHWRTPGQARWVPLLDTRLLERLAGGRKEETYWPVAVAQEKFYCIILKGGERYPQFPRPLLAEFGFQMPLESALPSSNGKEEETGLANETRRLEENFVKADILHALQADLVAATHATSDQQWELSQKSLEIDKALLQLLGANCREGENRGMKALEIVTLLRDKRPKMLEAAGKVAARFEQHVLGEKIRDLAERRLVGLEDTDEPYS